MQEAPLDIPEAQSPTLMIQGVLGELNPAGEIANVPGMIGERRRRARAPLRKRKMQKTGEP